MHTLNRSHIASFAGIIFRCHSVTVSADYCAIHDSRILHTYLYQPYTSSCICQVNYEIEALV